MDTKDLKDILKDLGTERSKQETITPISGVERLQKCKCGHLKRYHLPESRDQICKYTENGTCQCRGFVLRAGDVENKEKV